MDRVGNAKQAQAGHASPDEAQGAETSSARPLRVDMPSPHGEDADDQPTTNPDFSVPSLNPAFTRASPPPPGPPSDAIQAQQEARIRELERLLAEASRQIDRGAAVLERSRRRR